ncbi:MAG: acetyl-CoA carboxylase, biotin carboxyl carrier protein [Holosporales bacterium]|jgi:acetyl-CoA carboxylase biotin carboxyl carrier protein|nr:acetyl-CoA carboxylase, biotin carboxyl carrier protein [Holosporales bacterium]
MASFKIDESVFDKLAEILKKHNLTEIEYKDGETKIRMSMANNSSSVDTIATLGQAPKSISIEAGPPLPTDFSKHPGALKSPMVGTCYLAPEPGAVNFVSIGDSVQEGQPLLIIEAMKVMNLIKSPKAGKIIHVAVKNSDPIEFGQLLVVIE